MDEVDTAGRDLTVSFESMHRIMGSHAALGELIQAQGFTSSFESAYRPLLGAIYAGTSHDVDEMSLSLESAKVVLAALWKAFIDSVKQFFSKLYTFLKNMDLAAIWMSRQIAVIERKITANRGKVASERTLVLGNAGRFLQYGRLFADDQMKLDTELSHLGKVLEVVRNSLVVGVLDYADKIPATTGSLRGSELDSAYTQLVLAMPLAGVATKLHMTAAPQCRFNRDGVLMSPPLLGGKSIFFLQGKLIEKGTRGFRFHGMIYDKSLENMSPFAVDRDFKVISPNEMTNTPKLIKDVLEGISKTTNSSMAGRIARTEQTLNSFLKKCESDVDGFTSSDVDLVRRTTTTFMYWIHNVVQPLSSTAATVCRASITYCNASLNAL